MKIILKLSKPREAPAKSSSRVQKLKKLVPRKSNETARRIKLKLKPAKGRNEPVKGIWNEVDWNPCTPSYTSIQASTAGSLSPKSARSYDMPAGSVAELYGDILKTPTGSLILHACNAKGIWGRGVAEQLRSAFPAAYQIYRKHCSGGPDRWQMLLGTTLLIPPQKRDLKTGGSHWIGCVFTKNDPGAPTAPFGHADVYQATSMALQDLAAQVNDLGMERFSGGIWSPRLNAGIFRVPWEVTREQIEDTGLSVTVVNWRDVASKATEMTSQETTHEIETFMDMVAKQREQYRTSTPRIKTCVSKPKRTSRTTSPKSRRASPATTEQKIKKTEEPLRTRSAGVAKKQSPPRAVKTTSKDKRKSW